MADTFNFAGYSNAVLFAEVLRRCGDDLTQRILMNVATHLDHVRMPSLLPVTTLNTSPTDYDPMKRMRTERFDGNVGCYSATSSKNRFGSEGSAAAGLWRRAHLNVSV